MMEERMETSPSSPKTEIVHTQEDASNTHALGEQPEDGPSLREHLGDDVKKGQCVSEKAGVEVTRGIADLDVKEADDEDIRDDVIREEQTEAEHVVNEAQGIKEDGDCEDRLLGNRQEQHHQDQPSHDNIPDGELGSTLDTIQHTHATNHISAESVIEINKENGISKMAVTSADEPMVPLGMTETNHDVLQNAFPTSVSSYDHSETESDGRSESPATCTNPPLISERHNQDAEAQEESNHHSTVEITSNGPLDETSALCARTEPVSSDHNPETSLDHHPSPCAITDCDTPQDVPSISKSDHSQMAVTNKTIESRLVEEQSNERMTDPVKGTAAADNVTCNGPGSQAIPRQMQTALEQVDLRTGTDVQAIKNQTESVKTFLSKQECAHVGVDVSEAMCQDPYDELMSELDAEFDELLGPQAMAAGDPANGLLKRGRAADNIQEFKLMRAQSDELQNKVDTLQGELKRMQEQVCGQRQQIVHLEQERESSVLKLNKGGLAENVHLLKIRELEVQINLQNVEVGASKERLLSHDAAAKKAITKLQQEMILRVDQVKSMYEETLKEKESIVMKYAKSEKEVMDQKKLREALERKQRELTLMVESLNTQLKDSKKVRNKMKHSAVSKETEASSLQKEIDQLKEEVSSQGIKVKWAQNKLKTELDSHKDTKVKLAKTEQRLTEAKEETEQIRKNCQEMIKTYQTSEEVKSNSLDKQLKVKHSELELQLQEQRDHLEVHQARLRELESLKKSLADNIAELDSFKVKAKCLEDDRLQSEVLLAKFKELLNSQKEENRRLNKQLEEKKVLSQQLEHLKETELQLRSEVSGQKVDQTDLEMELDVSRQKATELLQFTEKITARNTNLSSDNSVLQSKASSLESEVQRLQRDLEELQTSYSQLSSELKQERQFRERESSILTTKLSEKSRALEQLSIQLDEARDDNKTLKRKHVANTKDLTRQLQQAHKRLESLESTDNNPRDNISVGSRTSSSGSLDTLPGSTPSAVNSSGSSVSVTTSGSSRTDEHSAPQDHTVAIATGNDYPGVDKGMLVDRIVRLQKAHQRKNDKMEFMQEHITHLIEELKKKSKIIQQYVMRDEAGALVPVSSDINKAQISKQGGIMSSLYRSQQTDPGMTLDLSLEINRKLQAVLEDTLLKNITLKDNIETLGQEIARLLKDKQKVPQHHTGHR